MDTRKNPAKQPSVKKAKAGEAAKSARISGNRPSSRAEESEDEEKASEVESGRNRLKMKKKTMMRRNQNQQQGR
jgi:hypothetical protein